MLDVKRAVGSTLAQTYAAYTYSTNGLPLTLTDARNNRSTYEYDGHDRRVKLRYPRPTTAGISSTTDYEQFTYNAVGSITTHRKRSGQNVTLGYDNLHRLISRTYPATADNVAFSYDLLGRRTQAKYADNSHTVDYVWDAAGRLSSTTAGAKTLAYQYDPAGKRTRTTWPETAFYVTTTYDALNRPTAIKELGSTNLASYAYDDLSRRTTVSLTAPRPPTATARRAHSPAWRTIWPAPRRTRPPPTPATRCRRSWARAGRTTCTNGRATPTAPRATRPTA